MTRQTMTTPVTRSPCCINAACRPVAANNKVMQMPVSRLADNYSPRVGHSGRLQTAQLSKLGRSNRSRQVRSTVVRAEQVEVKERFVATLPYLVPLFDGLRYGKFALVQFPFIYSLLSPLDPLLRIYTSVPFASLAVFFAIYIGIINQRGTWSRYVRFNAMQAILLDILLILPGVFENVFRPPMSGPGLSLYINIYNTIFFFVLACWLYGSGSCLLGRAARLPLVADAADQQVPF